jgi:hypothetical protein
MSLCQLSLCPSNKQIFFAFLDLSRFLYKGTELITI